MPPKPNLIKVFIAVATCRSLMHEERLNACTLTRQRLFYFLCNTGALTGDCGGRMLELLKMRSFFDFIEIHTACGRL
jgi:hypothetical protein